MNKYVNIHMSIYVINFTFQMNLFYWYSALIIQLNLQNKF